MPTKVIEDLIRAVASLQSDMEWVKKWIYACVSASLTAAIGVLGLLFKLLTH